ncbi:GDSL-type esterase/lipase family protein [Streptomyces sp. NPDC005562]|uniref:GDSL-type esterase/lipase family protein n=1 Tax=Streptomyces sp. NPDC005562 TaxID=3154890 RepID=UPI0033A4F7A1
MAPPLIKRQKAVITATAGTLVALAALASATVAPAHAAVADERPLLVTLGDSFISGEAGRWAGNSNESAEGHAGTDRAWNPQTRASDPHTVYGATYDDGCNRSDSAEVHSAPGPDRRVNLACSGATSTAIRLPENGGEPFKGRPSQAEQLQLTADGHPVHAVVVSVGGNDLGFSGIISACAKNFVKPVFARPCSPTQAKAVEQRLPAMRAAVTAAVRDVRTAMTRAGHPADSYRLILQSAPSPLPDAARIRYPGDKFDRLYTGGCPFFDKDLTWAHDELGPDVSASLARVAQEQKTEFLDLSHAFDGREVCSDTTSQAGQNERPSGVRSEWVRFITSGLGQGQRQESLHPNYYGQLALGTCLGLALDRAPGAYRCDNMPQRSPRSMTMRPAGT